MKKRDDLYQLVTDNALSQILKGRTNQQKQVLFYMDVYGYFGADLEAVMKTTKRNITGLWELFIKHCTGGEFIKNILIIEDDKVLSDGIVLALQREKLAMTQCFDLASAREKTAAQAFDLLLLDINLPGGNGLNFIKELRKTQNVPVILLTANDLKRDIVAGLELGADDYITKPFSLAVLRARVHTQLRKQAGVENYVQDGF